MSQYKKNSSEEIHKNPWWTYYHDKIILANGEPGDYYYGETIGSGCAIIVPVLDDGRLVLVSQYRYLRDKKSVEFPCGGLKKNESPSEAGERELLEETGYRASEIIKIGSFDALNAVFKDTAHVFAATGLELSGPQQLEKFEQGTIEVFYRRVDEFEEMIKNGQIWDGQTLAAWTLVRDYVYKGI